MARLGVGVTSDKPNAAIKRYGDTAKKSRIVLVASIYTYHGHKMTFVGGNSLSRFRLKTHPPSPSQREGERSTGTVWGRTPPNRAEKSSPPLGAGLGVGVLPPDHSGNDSARTRLKTHVGSEELNGEVRGGVLPRGKGRDLPARFFGAKAPKNRAI